MLYKVFERDKIDEILIADGYRLLQGNVTWRHKRKEGIPLEYLNVIAGKTFECIGEGRGIFGQYYYETVDLFDCDYKVILKILCTPVLMEKLDKILNE